MEDRATTVVPERSGWSAPRAPPAVSSAAPSGPYLLATNATANAGAGAERAAGLGGWCWVRSMRSPSSCSRSPICSAAGTARVSTYQAATSHISTSTQILASRKASGSSRASPATASSPRPPDPRTSCCRSFRRVGENPILGMYGPLRFLTRNVPL